MPAPGVPLQKLGCLTLGVFDDSDPPAGHVMTLRCIELGEQRGCDSA